MKKLATSVGETYRCDVCGNVVKVVNSGAGVLVCCGEAMVKIEEAD
ncbi:desulfoferrodoxin FeS4 iron-binding domain-containing protein [Dethiobacter alkaliphilus]|uniref:Desulfoferrodoxin Dfx domain protein n=1 Tax=Dethiobacter alkaliphilus AHT 1 TaxID=555088 RepID=C0GKM9_DETAL|nr:desulfoferrodoxin FeS4 iron-binding domain-containing protein [Dethiobacter alkaliphilus]EEG76121.1 Desulfoferrodoxin Dfx domain protein [Dethiobacter alkaliphilus AHT 1]MCW3489609.1 desulfoferrodoxin FeS4 iron-binding domain-containing protein [Dethiobacter alkaliphilus]